MCHLIQLLMNPTQPSVFLANTAIPSFKPIMLHTQPKAQPSRALLKEMSFFPSFLKVFNDSSKTLQGISRRCMAICIYTYIQSQTPQENNNTISPISASSLRERSKTSNFNQESSLLRKSLKEKKKHSLSL